MQLRRSARFVIAFIVLTGATGLQSGRAQPAQDATFTGIEAMVPMRGPVRDILYQMVGGLRSGLSYAGAATIEELWEKAEFVRITSAGKRESGAHDVETQ